MVALYHAFARWPVYMPWAYARAEWPLLQHGNQSVQLFFLISGFVILMSLRKSTRFPVFLYKRWLRLFPGMVLATAVIWLSAGFFHERPAGWPTLPNALPGLLFLEPEWISALLGFPVRALEGSFWSLFVEVKFYVLFGLAYFAFPRASLHLLGSAFALSVLVRILDKLSLGGSAAAQTLTWVTQAGSLESFGWFAAGAWYYSFRETRRPLALLSSAAYALASALVVMGTRNPTGLLFLGGLYLIFVGSFEWAPLRRLAASRVLVFLGFVSYPLYLIHENALVAGAMRLHDLAPWLGMLTPLPILGGLCAVAWVIARFGEPRLRALLQVPDRVLPLTLGAAALAGLLVLVWVVGSPSPAVTDGKGARA